MIPGTKMTNTGLICGMDHRKSNFLLILAPFLPEAVEVIEAAEVLMPGKSQLGTSESSKFLNSALF